METTMQTMIPDTAMSRADVPPAETATERRNGVVRRGEFRLLLWMNAFALTAVLGGMTVLYTGITDLRVAMEAQRADILDVVRSENADLRERVARIETRLVAVETRLGTIETRLDAVETRLDGVETRLNGVETRLDGVETRLVVVETRLDGVETRLVAVETRLDTVEVRLGAVETRLDTIISPSAKSG